MPGFYATTCLTCYSGKYCPENRMDSINDFLCKEGFYCKEGNIIPNPVAVVDGSSNIIGDECAVGKHCPYQLIHEFDCPDGFVSKEKGLAVCDSCPLGFFCDNKVTDVEEECIRGSTCRAGEKRQPICPIGQYLFEDQTVSYCANCTATNYCRANIIVDNCAAGFVCEQMVNGEPNPAGYECTPGKYCPKGSIDEIYCPKETMSLITAAEQITDCTGCQPGWVCEFGNRTAYPCPKGHYCPVDGTFYNHYMFKCPLGTYNKYEQKAFMYECQDCPEGYYCDELGIFNVTDRECPRGHYCPEGTDFPRACPPGTYADVFGTTEEVDCIECTAGYFCPEGTDDPLECSDGNFCPRGTSTMITCEGGYYCNKQTRH